MAGADDEGLESEALDTEECEARAARLHACFDFDDLDDEDEPPAELPAAEAPQGSSPAPAKTGPVFFFARGLECGELVEDVHGERAACVFLFAAGGLCSAAAARLCGRYSPLCRRASSGSSVEVRVKHDLILGGTEAKPLYIHSGSLYGDSAPQTGNARLLLAWWDIWCIFDGASGEILARAEHLDAAEMKKLEGGAGTAEASAVESEAVQPEVDSQGAGGGRGRGHRRGGSERRLAQWFVKTSLAMETEYGLRSLLAREPPEEAWQLPVPWPRPRPGRQPARLSARVICLPERAESVALLMQQFEDLCSHGAVQPNIQPHRAWDTRGLDVALLREKGFVAGDRWKEGDKLLGCALSHSELWLALAQDEGKNLGGTAGALLVLEDDAVLNSARPFELMLQEVLGRAGDYDVLLLGAMADESWAKECTRNSPPQWVSDHLLRVQYFGGFWGYLITARGARRALRALWGTSDFPRSLAGDCDILVACACASGQLEAALCVPHLVLHPGWFGGCSNTRCSCVDYEYVLDAKRLVEIGARRSLSSRYSQRLAFVRERESDALPLEDVGALIRRCREAASVGAPSRRDTLENHNQQLVKDFMRRRAVSSSSR